MLTFLFSAKEFHSASQSNILTPIHSDVHPSLLSPGVLIKGMFYIHMPVEEVCDAPWPRSDKESNINTN